MIVVMHLASMYGVINQYWIPTLTTKCRLLQKEIALRIYPINKKNEIILLKFSGACKWEKDYI